MKSLIESLTMEVEAAFVEAGLPAGYGSVLISQRPDLCQFQCNGALAAGKKERRNPRDIGEVVAEKMRSKEFISGAAVEGAGFINLKVTDDFLARHLNGMKKDEKKGIENVVREKKVVLDFGGPNLAKAMHVGHLRPTIIGDCLQRTFRFAGFEVVSDVHLGDWGTQMGMLIRQTQREHPEWGLREGGEPRENYELKVEDLERMYPAASELAKKDADEASAARRAIQRLQAGDPAYRSFWAFIRRISVEDLNKTFADLGVRFDLWKGESDYQDRIPGMVERLKKAGYAVESQGAWVITVMREGEDHEIPPLMLVKSDGGYPYASSDLATVEERVSDLKADLVLYVVDKRQALHFEQVFRAARKTGLAGQCGLEHIAFGTVNGKDGKPFKTRQGGVMKLGELIGMARDEARHRMDEAGLSKEVPPAEREGIANMVGLAALKFADLVNHRTSDYVLDLEKFTTFEGKTGPYLLYTAVRIKSILRKAEERGLKPGPVMNLGEKERELALALARFPESVKETITLRAPNHLCEYAYDLSQVFSRFYQNCHILNEQDQLRQASWLGLAGLCLDILTRLLDLMGIEIPEKM